MDLSTVTRRVFSLVLVFAVVLSLVTGAPAQQSHGSSAGSSLSLLRESIMELENVMYKLKDFSRELQAAYNARDAAMLGDAEPEFDINDLQRLAAAAKASRHSSAGQKSKLTADQSASDIDSISDNSMKEALEYLMSLANEKKQDKRDHDIPFPLMDRDGQ